MAVKLIVDTYENGTKVVTHIFHGKTQKEARGYERAHRRTDKFYNASVTGKPFMGLNLSYDAYLEE